MATSFNSGFALGNQMFNQAERNRLLAEQDAREAEAHKLRMEEGGLRVAGLRRVEDATQNLGRLTNVGVQNPEAVKANDADFDMAVEATGRGLPMPAAAPQQQEWRKATGLELNDAQARLAAARGDIQGMEALRLGRKGIEYDEGYKKHFEDWNKMDDDAKGALIDKLSLDANIKGYGSWVPGKGKQSGYMNYMAPGADPIKLSAKEAGDLYVLTNLMQIDPTRARAEMDKVSDKVRAVAAQAFETQTKGVTTNNQATRFGNQDANDEARLGVERDRLGVERDKLGVTRDYYQSRSQLDRMGSAQYFTGADGNTYASIPTMTREGLKFETVRVNPEGIKLGKVGADGKPIKVEEEGTKMTMGGKLHFADGLGGWIPANSSGAPAGVMPSARSQALKAAGVPDNFIDKLQWNADGTAVGYNGMRFGLNELRAIPKELERIERNTKAAEEDSKRSMGLHGAMRRQREMRENPPQPSNSGFGPRITFRPDPYAPSPNAGPEEWQAYRFYQNR